MKTFKTFLILSIFFYSFIGFSQSDEESSTAPTTKGNFILGGSSRFGFSIATSQLKSDSGDIQNGETRNTSFGLRPRVGYFIINDLAIGGEVAFSTSKAKNDDLNFEATGTSFSFAPFVRYYFTEGIIKPFLQGSVGIGFSNSKTEGDFGENESKNSIFNYGFDGGVTFFLNKSISIDTGIGYAYSSSKARDNNDDNVRFVNSGFFFSTGINIFF